MSTLRAVLPFLVCLTFFSGAANAQTENYAAPFGDTGSATPPPNVPAPAIAADTINEVPPTGLVTPTASNVPPPPVQPPPANAADLATESRNAAIRVCSGIIPSVYEGFYEYINNDYNNVDNISLAFLPPFTTSPGVDEEVLKNCMEYGYRPAETAGMTCEFCYTINHSVPTGFYASHTTATYSGLDGTDTYDFTNVTPSYLRNCLLAGYRPPEAPGYIDANACTAYNGGG